MLFKNSTLLSTSYLISWQQGTYLAYVYASCCLRPTFRCRPTNFWWTSSDMRQGWRKFKLRFVYKICKLSTVNIVLRVIIQRRQNGSRFNVWWTSLTGGCECDKYDWDFIRQKRADHNSATWPGLSVLKMPRRRRRGCTGAGLSLIHISEPTRPY